MTQETAHHHVNEEKGFAELNKLLSKNNWWDKTLLVEACNVVPDSHGMEDLERRDSTQLFWNSYLYSGFKETYFQLFPGDQDMCQRPDQLDLVEYNRKMILALSKWVEQNDVFHYFENRIVFVRYNSYGLAMGDLLVNGAPLHIYQGQNIAHLMNEMLQAYLKARRNGEVAWRWVAGLVIAMGLFGFALL